MIQQTTIFLLFLVAILNSGQAQVKTFFDKSGKSCTESKALYYRTQTGTNSYKSFYKADNFIYFEGNISKPSIINEKFNIYQGKCKWYYRNGNIKMQRNFNSEGEEDSISIYNFESGILKREISFKNGVYDPLNSREFTEAGAVTRTFEEPFEDSSGNWELQNDGKISSKILDGKLVLESLENEACFVSKENPISEIRNFSYEGKISLNKIPGKTIAGLVFGMKDNFNYSFFFINKNQYFIGEYNEGVVKYYFNAMKTSHIKTGINILKISVSGDKLYYFINGELEINSELLSFKSNKIGVAVLGKGQISVEELKYTDLEAK